MNPSPPRPSPLSSIARNYAKPAGVRAAIYCAPTSNDPVQLWTWYIQLTEIEQAFKELKGDLSIRPIYHQLDTQIEAHIFVARAIA